MSTLTIDAAPVVEHATSQRSSSLSFDWLMIALSTWLGFGIYLDGWAHNTRPELETFFTPWHAVLYAGFLANLSFVLAVLVANHRQGIAWREALPTGYNLTLLGMGLFFASGIGDAIWHIIFGIESNVEALLSPTHLGLAIGVALIVSGPLRAASAKVLRGAESWENLLPAILSLTFILSTFTFITQYAHLLARTSPANNYVATWRQISEARDIASVVLQSAILVGLLLIFMRRWTMPPGGFTVIIGLNALMMTMMTREWLTTGVLPLFVAALVTGVAVDLLYIRLQPDVRRSLQLRIFAAAVPTIFYTLYFLAIMLFGDGIWWSVHLWTGTIFMAGITGLLLTFLMLSPESLTPQGTSIQPDSR